MPPRKFILIGESRVFTLTAQERTFTLEGERRFEKTVSIFYPLYPRVGLYPSPTLYPGGEYKGLPVLTAR